MPFPADQINGADMVPVLNQFVGFGDMVAANEITRMLAARGAAQPGSRSPAASAFPACAA